MQTSISIEIGDLTDKFNRLSLTNDIKEFIDKYATDAKPDLNIEFIPYIPCPEIFNKTKPAKGQNSSDFDIKCEVVDTFKKFFISITCY